MISSFAFCLALASGFTAGVDALIKPILPTTEEQKWLTVPWRLNLMQARKESAESGKPIFLWMMNGHPMGCT